MKNIVFIVTDSNRNTLHVGLSADLIKTMDFYSKMPNLIFDGNQKLSILVYFEEFSSELIAMQRFKTLSQYTRSQKEKLIRSVNNNWLDLTLALNYERKCQKGYQNIQPVFSYAS